MKTNIEDIQQYATIADNLPASHTEIDPTPQVKEDAAAAFATQQPPTDEVNPDE